MGDAVVPIVPMELVEGDAIAPIAAPVLSMAVDDIALLRPQQQQQQPPPQPP